MTTSARHSNLFCPLRPRNAHESRRTHRVCGGDDDPSVRETLADLIASVGLSVLAFKSAREFLESRRPDAPACLVLDVRLPGLSGLDLQRALLRFEAPIPIVFITGHGDIPMS